MRSIYLLSDQLKQKDLIKQIESDVAVLKDYQYIGIKNELNNLLTTVVFVVSMCKLQMIYLCAIIIGILIYNK